MSTMRYDQRYSIHYVLTVFSFMHSLLYDETVHFFPSQFTGFLKDFLFAEAVGFHYLLFCSQAQNIDISKHTVKWHASFL